MKKAFKVIKKKDFDNGTVKGTNYILAVQGRAVNFSSLTFQDSDVKFDLNKSKTHLEISGEIEVIKDTYIDSLGQTKIGLKFMPKFGFDLSDI